MNHNPDEYYNMPEVSNSDLTALKELLHPRLFGGNKERAFYIGNLVDAIVTEPSRVNFYSRTVDDVTYNDEDFLFGMEMFHALQREAKKDSFLSHVLNSAVTQKVSVNHDHKFTYQGFHFQLDTRCKWDWFFPRLNFGGDLKTTSAHSQKEFEDAYNFLDIDRSRAWYMDVTGTDKDFVYAISKVNLKVFKIFIDRNSELYRRGRGKYEELAFHYYLYN